MLSNQIKSSEKITLVERTKVLKNDKRTATVLNNFFSTIIQILKIPQYKEQDPIFASFSDPAIRAIVKYRGLPSIIAIKENCNSSTPFNFSFLDKEDILKEIKNLKANKATQNTNISTKLIKENSGITADFIFENLNGSISQSVFPSALKLANITPVHKNIQKVKKIFTGPSMSYQISLKYMKGFSLNKFLNILYNFFFKYQCRFRKGFNTQHSLLSVLEKWKPSADNKKVFGALLTDLSKALFDCLSHDFLIAKLNSYGFRKPALRLIQNYFSNQKQRTKINTEYSSWEEILFGVPQGSILGSLLFNIFLWDLFLIMNNIELASNADDYTPYAVGNNIEELIVKLQNASKTLFQCFSDNQRK